MKILHIFTIFAALILVGCDLSGERAKLDDLYVGGIYERRLLLDGTQGVSSTFTITAKHDWSIIDYKGFTCDPSYGIKSDEPVTITATPIKSNNTSDTLRLSDLNFKLLSTRFVGISAYQLPQIRLPKGHRVDVGAYSGAKSTISMISSVEDVEFVVSGDIKISHRYVADKREYTITIETTRDNNAPSERIVGTIGFKVDGVTQESVVNVIQMSALKFDRSIVLLPNKAGVETQLGIESNFNLEVSTASTLFSVQKKNQKSYIVKSLSANTSGKDALLGTIDVTLKEYPDCHASIEVWQRANIAPQTIVAYFVGTALKTYFDNNISAMLTALSSNIQGDSQIVIITTDSTNDATLYELRYDKLLGKAVREKIGELSLPTPYNADLFETNLRAALSYAPAKKYALLIGSHGLAWIPKYSSVATYSALRRLGLDPSTLWQRDPNAEMTRHIGDKNPTRFDITEVADAIKANNVKFEYILFDSCFMGNVESSYELRNSAKYIIGSPCEVMGAGFPYDQIVPYMFTENGTSYNLNKICSTYVDYYRTAAVTPSACISVTHTSELEALAKAMKAVNAESVKSSFSLNNVQYYEGLNPHTFYDLGDIVEQSCANAKVAADFKAQLDKTVTSRYHTDIFYSAFGNSSNYHTINYYSGITTSAMVEHYAAEWSNTAWYKATH